MTPATPSQAVPFPMLVLAAVIVAAGIYVVDQFDSKAGWLLAFLVLLGVSFGYRDFGNEITSLFGAVAVNQQTNVPSGQLAAGQQGPLPTTLVGPLGPIA